MLAPEPPVKLEGHCSVIHDNTLYTFSSNGFASISLERNGKWLPLKTDGAELVSDAVCVIGGVDGNENKTALYVVGGTSSKSDPPGLQRFSFEDNTWKTLNVAVDNLANRTGHSAVYLRSISTILSYGGSTTDGSQPSSETFKVITKPTYSLDSGTGYSSPAVSPPLLTWSDDTAVLFGGPETPEEPRFWNSDQEWHNSGYPSLNLTFPTGVKAALFQSSDENRMVQAFDLNQSPVDVSFRVLSPKINQASKKRKRDDSPTYDGTLAPKLSDRSYSFAQGDLDSPLVVISGGSGTDTLSIFNQTSYSWVNTTQLFYGDKSEQEILGSSSTTTTTTTTTPTTPTTPSSSPTATSTDSSTETNSTSDDDSDANVGTILGAVLGSLAGVAIILVLILLYIKRKKEKARQADGMGKDRLSFQDQGVEPLTRSAYPMAVSRAPKAAASVDSLAIFSGNMGDEKSPRSAGSLPQYMHKTQPAKPSPLNNIQSSDDSGYGPDDKAIEAGQSPVRRTTDEGWGKYFQDNNTTPTLIGVQSPYDSTRGSKATIWPGTNNALPPLQTSFLQEPTPLGRVNSGSPTTEIGRHIAIPESQSARISSASSASFNSDDGDHDEGVREQSWLGRPPSSAYSRSFYNPGSTRDALSTMAPSTVAPSVDYRRHDSHRTNTRGSSVLIPDGQPLPRNNVNSDMSWLNLNADR